MSLPGAARVAAGGARMHASTDACNMVDREAGFPLMPHATKIPTCALPRRIACGVRVLFFYVAGCDVAGTKIAGTADAQCVGPTAAAEEDTKIVLVATATDNENVGFVIGFDGTKIVDVVIGFELE